MADLVAAEQADESAATEQRQERVASRRLDAAEAVARRVSGELAAARAELAGEHERRLELEGLRSRLERKVAQLEVELGGARRKVAHAERDLAAAGASAAAGDQRAADAVARMAVVEAQRDEAEARARVAEAALELARRGGADGAATATAPRAAGAGAVDRAMGGVPATSVDRPATLVGGADTGALVDALSEAAAATQRLGQALAAAAAAVGPIALSEPCRPERALGGDAPSRPSGAARRRRPNRRTPLPLPGGVFADTTEAATHLVRQPGVLLVVDGYNVAKLGWPDEPLPVERERLLDALEELVARHGTAVHVVFDGADVWTAPSTCRRRLRVEFSPAGVSADDVIVEMVGSLPAERPIVVATNDGEVRAGARAGGANVVSSQQLLAVARR